MEPVDVKPDRDKQRITLKDIAAELGVAASTVSNAYNRPDQLSAELRAKILDTAARLGYAGPDPTARSLRRGVTHTIGLVYPSPLSYTFTDPVAALFVRGIALEVEREGYTLLLVGGAANDGRERSLTPVTAAKVDGFILHCFDDDDPLLHAALARDLPTVMVDNRTVPGIPHVAVDDEGGARAAAEHLLALGHRRFGIASLELDLEAIGGVADLARQESVGYATTRARLRGYRAAIDAAGLDWARDVTVWECLDNRVDDGHEAAAALLAQQPRPTAILTMSDQLALGALEHAHAQGIAVPADLSVVGFDDAPAAARTDPPLTTVHQPFVDKGRATGRLLLTQLRGEAPPPPVTLPTRLAVRGSSGDAPEV